MAAPVGMIFSIDRYGNPQPEASLNNGVAWSDSPPTGDFILVVTGCPASASPASVAALVTSYCTLPLPWTINGNASPIRFQVPYSPLQASVQTIATRW